MKLFRKFQIHIHNRIPPPSSRIPKSTQLFHFQNSFADLERLSLPPP